MIPKSWEYFVIENLNYHGFNLTVLWDLNGSKYKAGSGLRVFLNGTLVFSQNNLSKTVISIPDAVVEEQSYKRIENYAANVKHSGFPLPRASFVDPYSSTWQAVDGNLILKLIENPKIMCYNDLQEGYSMIQCQVIDGQIIYLQMKLIGFPLILEDKNHSILFRFIFILMYHLMEMEKLIVQLKFKLNILIHKINGCQLTIK